MKKLLVFTLIVGAFMPESDASTVGWGAQSSNALGLADGSLAPELGLLRLGIFTVPDAQIRDYAAAGDRTGLDAAFVEFGSSAIVAGYDLPGVWGAVTVKVDPVFVGQQIYYWAVDAPTLEGATQWGIFTNPASSSWVFPADAPVPGATNTDLAEVPTDSTGLIIGSFGGGPDDIFGAPLYEMAAIIPEPASALLLLGSGALLLLRRRRA